MPSLARPCDALKSSAVLGVPCVAVLCTVYSLTPITTAGPGSVTETLPGDGRIMREGALTGLAAAAQ